MKHLHSCCIALALAACAPGREPTTVPLFAAFVLPSTPNDHGWRVEVTSLQVTLDGVRFYEGEPLLASVGGALWKLFGGVARAHPGHYEAGEALGEWLGSRTLDGLVGPVEIGTADAFTGHVGSGWLSFGDDAIRLSGVARKQDEMRPFEVRLEITDDLSGLAGSHELTAAPTTATLTFDVARWLVAADFSTALDANDDGTFELAPGTQAHNALRRGTLDVGAYRLSWNGAP